MRDQTGGQTTDTDKKSGALISGAAHLGLRILIIASFLLLVCYYGNAVLPLWPDEVLFLQPAENLSKGQGMGTPLLDDLLPGISERTYWQPPIYFMILSLWCRWAGFTVDSARLLSRLIGTLLLFTLIFLCKRLNLNPVFCSLSLLWIAADAAFQFSSNVGRMEVLCAFFTILCLLLFPPSDGKPSPCRSFFSGMAATASSLCHFLSIPVVAILTVRVFTLKPKANSVWFLIPLMIGWTVWFIYAFQDFPSFIGQLKLQMMRKGQHLARSPFAAIGTLHLMKPLHAFSYNSPPILLALAAGWLCIKLRKDEESRWIVLCSFLACLSAGLGAEQWYLGWMAPFCYLIFAVFADTLSASSLRRTLILMAGLIWFGIQLRSVREASASVTPLQRSTATFEKEVSDLIPYGATILIYCTPDPTLRLLGFRNDIRIIQFSPTPIESHQMHRLLREADFFLGIEKWVLRKGMKLEDPCLRRWVFTTSIGQWNVGWYRLPRRMRGT